MTAKFDKFEEALEDLCLEHKVYIYADCIYEAIGVKDSTDHSSVGQMSDQTKGGKDWQGI